MSRFRFSTRLLIIATLLIAGALAVYVGRLNSLARFTRLTQGLNDKFTDSKYPLTTQERQLTDTLRIPDKNWIVMFGNMKPPNFWEDNIRKCEIGAGLNRAATTC